MLKYIFEKLFWKLCEHDYQFKIKINHVYTNNKNEIPHKYTDVYICTKCLKKKEVKY